MRAIKFRTRYGARCRVTEDRVEGLERGSDDDLPKPFDSADLPARVRVSTRPAAYAAETVRTQMTPGRHDRSGSLPIPPAGRAQQQTADLHVAFAVSKVGFVSPCASPATFSSTNARGAIS